LTALLQGLACLFAVAELWSVYSPRTAPWMLVTTFDSFMTGARVSFLPLLSFGLCTAPGLRLGCWSELLTALFLPLHVGCNCRYRRYCPYCQIIDIFYIYITIWFSSTGLACHSLFHLCWLCVCVCVCVCVQIGIGRPTMAATNGSQLVNELKGLVERCLVPLQCMGMSLPRPRCNA
jgi:hypothetical protein